MMATDATIELRLDVDEFKNLLVASQRQRVKDTLLAEIRKLQTEIRLIHEELQHSATPISAPVKPRPLVDVKKKLATETTLKHGESQCTATPISGPVKPRPTVYLKIYGWDQSDSFVNVYTTIPKVEIYKERVTCNFKNRSFSVYCEDVNNKNYFFEISSLMEEIDPAESHLQVLPNIIYIVLKKKEVGYTWSNTTEEKIKDKPEIKLIDTDNTGPNESLLNFMKNMNYKGDEDMKRTNTKARTESQEKQGLGDMGI